MDYNYRDSSNDGGGLTFEQSMQYVTRILQKWWMVAICAIVCAAVGFIVAAVTYEPSYSTTLRFAIDNKSENTVASGQSSSDINAGILLARNYKTIMTDTDSLMRDVARDSGYDITGPEIKRMLRASLGDEQSIIVITFTTNNPDLTYALATSYVKNYSKTTERAYQSTQAKLYDEPIKPTKPNADNSKIMYSLLGFIFGAGAAVLGICINIVIKDTLKSSDDVSVKLNSKLLGQVIQIKKNDKLSKSILISDKRTGFMFIESFKIIRTRLESVSKRQGYKVFMFTSTYENEGKTTVATNTALSLAKNGKSVLLIDADLRKPAVFKTLGVSATNETGLTGVVKGERTLSESIKYFEKFNLFLLITSQPVADSAELLSLDSMPEIIDAVKNEFDYVIIDTPPGAVVADTAIIAQYADACVMVVRNDNAPARKVKKIIDDITGVGTEVVGCIFNCSKSNAASVLSRRSRQNRSYGYGYGYGSDESGRRTSRESRHFEDE